ncbi:MAG: hypothetical protein HDR14_04625 [Lachnospiraceae bacterium]|nr:hypothetical protein [Lachnospiraceae bacterium]
MKRTQKKQATDLALLLCRAHEEIRKVIENQNLTAALGLLEQCQKGAMRLGDLIEQSEGKDFVTIPMLEDYCELVYQIYEEAVQNPLVDAARAYRLLQESLTCITNSIRQDIQERLVAVFLPCKVEMWPALESVWEAAAADPICDAYVIPLPYYYKNYDGSFGKECYDGDKYPDNVPITKYDTFDFERYRPDMIFIQVPFDEYNQTMSVHPFFYSANLKKFTDKLIYIPYFLLDEIELRDERGLENMVHFAAMPGVVNADKVIVQSEAMRQTYIDYLSNMAGESSRAIWEEKILGLGSPMQERPKRTWENVRDLPGEWEAMLQKPDGSYKKAILYGTSVSVLLQYGEKYLRKMKNVFLTFREKRDEMVLWWRPYPLAMMKEAMSVGRQELLAEYENLVKMFQTESLGIYDETPGEERAVKFCDAYYGDGSSMVRLFCRQQKPVMRQNVDIILPLETE